MSAVDPLLVSELTVDARKIELYPTDPYVREGLMSFRQWGFRRVRDLTFVVLKPDAIAGRRVHSVLNVLASHGWWPVASTTVQFSPVLTRELWRYQFNAATEQRIAVVDHLLGSGRSLLILMEDRDRPPWLPASVRLTAAKGVADPARAGSADLRTRIGRVNGLFNFMHTADEPVDVVRELQLFSYQAGWEWCREAFAGMPGTPGHGDDPAGVCALLADLERHTPAHDLDLAASLDRLADLYGAWAALARERRDPAEIGGWLDELRSTPLPSGPARWDVLTVLTSWIECNERSVAALIPTVQASDWRPADDRAAS